LTLYRHEPISATHFVQIREAGFDAIAVTANYRDHMRGTRAEVDLIKTAVADNGLRVDSVHVGEDALTGDHQHEVDTLVHRDLALTAELGAKILVVHVGIFAAPERMIVKDGKFYPSFTVGRDLEQWPPMMDRIHSRLDKLTDMARQTGVALALETEYDNSHRLIDMVAPFDARHCGICFDTGHAHMDSGTVRLAELLGPRVIATHLHDNDGQDDQHLPPFHGSIDWRRLIAALKASGYDGYWTFELADARDLADLVTARARIVDMWSNV
jgi:sugar phosphate isomerase/epimerase